MLELRLITRTPYFYTLCGVALSLVAVVAWMLTFEPHGGPELSMYLFPLSVITLERIYPAQSVPDGFLVRVQYSCTGSWLELQSIS